MNQRPAWLAEPGALVQVLVGGQGVIGAGEWTPGARPGASQGHSGVSDLARRAFHQPQSICAAMNKIPAVMSDMTKS